MNKPNNVTGNSGTTFCSMKSEIFVVAATWAIAGGLGQLILLPFGMASGRIWLGLVLGATAQSVIYYYRSRNPYVR